MGFWRTPEFKALAAGWYDRLKRSGFADAEVEKGGRVHLKKWTSNAYGFVGYDDGEFDERRHLKKWKTKAATAHAYVAKERYFQALAECVSSCSFDRDVDRYVLGRKADGATNIQIARELKDGGMRPRHRLSVMVIVRKYEHRWGIRTWRPEHLDRNYRAKKGRG